MTTDSTAAQPTPKPPSSPWKWIKRIGCGLMLLLFTCCGVSCTCVWFLDSSMRNSNKEEVDRLHVEGLRDGDIEELHRRADDRFRRRFPLEDFQAFLRDRPGMLDRGNFNGMDFRKKVIDGAEFVKVKSKRNWFTLDEWEIVFRIVDGVYILVGISPGLDEFVPPAFRHRPASSRRHRFFD